MGASTRIAGALLDFNPECEDSSGFRIGQIGGMVVPFFGVEGMGFRAGQRVAAEAGEGAVRSTFVASDGTEIVGFTRHGINRAIGDGAKRAGTRPEAILDAIKNPTKITEGVDDLGRPFKVYRGGDARVVINPDTGRIVSVNPRSGAGANR